MKKSLFVALFAALLMVAAPAMAEDCNGGDCYQVDASADPGSYIGGYLMNTASTPFAGGGALGFNAAVTANSAAYGEDTYERVKVGYDYYGENCGRRGCTGYFAQKENGQIKWKFNYSGKGYEYLGAHRSPIYETHVIPGEGEAYASTFPTLSIAVDFDKFVSDELMTLGVTSVATLNIDGFAWAEGTDGCTQFADIYTFGGIGADAWTTSKVVNGESYAFGQAGGMTDVGFYGHDSDTSTYGFLWFPNKASVDFSSILDVTQSVYAKSFVSADGLKTSNFALSTGGDASLTLGRDGFLGLDADNIEITGINAGGYANQFSQAVGLGSVAAGGSSAMFSGANGAVQNTYGCFGILTGQTANVGGMAKAYGMNEIINSGNSIQVISTQGAYATTGNSGPVVQDIR
jgi:hypothetical protein